MYSKSYCAAVQGIEGCIIQIEADISEGLPNFSLVGYLSSEAKEARERVRIALRNTGFRFPAKRITINLSPADIRKDGTGYDLAIAAAILAACGYIPQEKLSQTLLIGELSLEGHINPVKGVLSMVYTAQEQGMKYCILPRDNQQEALAVKGIGTIGVAGLDEVIRIFREDSLEQSCRQGGVTVRDSGETLDFAEVKGQAALRRAVEVAVSGRHNLLMIGPPGTGKSMIAKRIPGILPAMGEEEQLEISRIYSVAGLLGPDMPILTRRPFRAPHHTISQAALVGGGRRPQPGEVSLASGGVLFLDELPEFHPQSIEALRQPLEDGWVNVARLSGSCRYPARSLLVAAMNPCKCGYYPDRSRCRCTPGQVRRYLGRISTPLLDRFDLCAEAVPLRYQELETGGQEAGEDTESIRRRIFQAYRVQEERYHRESFHYNGELPAKSVKKYCRLTKEAGDYLEMIFEKLSFSARAYHKILKVGRSIADLEGKEEIQRSHISEAVCYRSVDRKYWGGDGE